MIALLYGYPKHSVRKVKVFIVILIPKLSLNLVVALAAGVKSKLPAERGS